MVSALLGAISVVSIFVNACRIGIVVAGASLASHGR